MATTDKDVVVIEETKKGAIEIEDDKIDTSLLTYTLTSRPPVVITVFTALQHLFLLIPGALFTSTVISDAMCIPYTHPARATLFCATIFMSGFCTLIQVAFGMRLPILQGPAGSFLVPLLALKGQPGWECSESQLNPNAHTNVTINASHVDTQVIDEGIYSKLQEASGALMLASLLETLMGALGLMGFILRFIGPITVAVTITLIGISLVHLPIIFAKASYPMGIACLVLILIFILYFQKVKLPIPRCGKSRKEKGNVSLFPLFQLIPILIGIVIMWFISWLLTIFEVFTDDKTSIEYFARTDAKQDVITLSPWFELSYPGMWGPPKLNLALTVGWLFAATSSMVESIGDYYAAHKACEVERPPNSAISRGILIEGLGSFISGAVGVGHATTSHSGNIGLLILSKNASRAVMYAVGIMLIVLSLFAKAGAVITGIPSPILGGISMLSIATLVCIGLSNLRDVDMTCTRNLMVVGIPIVCGIAIPMCIEREPGVIDTGVAQVTDLLKIVLGSPMFLGGILAIIMDNTVPGTPASRGMIPRQGKQPKSETSNVDDSSNSYSWPWYSRLVKAVPFLTYLPFMPAKPVVNQHLEDDNSEAEELVENKLV